jgi:hypothetical protein
MLPFSYFHALIFFITKELNCLFFLLKARHRSTRSQEGLINSFLDGIDEAINWNTVTKAALEV